MSILIILCVILFYVGQLIEQLPSRFVAYIFNAILFIAVLYCFLDLTYTADWDMYYYFYKYENDKTDLVFQLLTLIFKKLYLSYNHLFKFHIIVAVSIYYLLISRFTKNIFFVFLAYLILDNVHFVNQIRYYLGFPILMMGYYLLFYKRQYILSVVFILISILCHSGLSFLLICIPIYYLVPTKKYYGYILIFSSIVFLITLYIFNSALGEILKHYGSYFAKDNVSSFLGGLFNAIPYIIFMAFLYIETYFLIKRQPEILEDAKFIFLYKISFFSVIFIPASFLIQVIGHRYVMAFSVFWVLYYYLYFIKNKKSRKQLIKFILLCSIVFASAIFIYIIPGYLFSENHFLEEFLEMVKSSDNLKGLID
ncbi:EpsG family protein [Chryseobacterium daecheongense]|uniref:EpsG family protein n=1 Tax=Chryseobacterium daecheongense TaxID=192389 RepID=UPI001FD6A152|nr:EpsG family protein [Chryseobacterium daecheongense]UOU96721.1 EpsG family protein [Chryseobacterium daecheongense]